MSISDRTTREQLRPQLQQLELEQQQQQELERQQQEREQLELERQQEREQLELKRQQLRQQLQQLIHVDVVDSSQLELERRLFRLQQRDVELNLEVIERRLREIERRLRETDEGEAEPQPQPQPEFGGPEVADDRRRLLSNTNQNNIGLYVYKYVNNESNIFEKQGNIATLTVILRDLNPMSQININDLYNKLYNYIYRIKDLQSDECLAGGYNTFNTNTNTNTRITFLETDPISIGNYCIHTCELINNTFMVYRAKQGQDKYIYVKKKELTKNENKLLAEDIYSNKTIDDKLKHIMNSSLKNKIGIIKYNIHNVKIIF